MSLLSTRLVLACLVLIVHPPLTFAQPALPTGAPQKAAISSDKPAEYTLAAKTAGVLTVAIHGEGDLAFTVTDADGQTVHVKVSSAFGRQSAKYRISSSLIP